MKSRPEDRHSMSLQQRIQRSLTMLRSRFFKLFFATTLILGTSASPQGLAERRQVGCALGDAQCCNTVTSASDPAVQSLIEMLGVALPDDSEFVGIGCTPISVVAGVASGSSCAPSQQPVCCTYNNFNGLINIGCTPLSA